MIFIDYFSHLGRLIAHGSSYFLKKTFGIGYYLHINLSTKNIVDKFVDKLFFTNYFSQGILSIQCQ